MPILDTSWCYNMRINQRGQSITSIAHSNPNCFIAYQLTYWSELPFHKWTVWYDIYRWQQWLVNNQIILFLLTVGPRSISFRRTGLFTSGHWSSSIIIGLKKPKGSLRLAVNLGETVTNLKQFQSIPSIRSSFQWTSTSFKPSDWLTWQKQIIQLSTEL